MRLYIKYVCNNCGMRFNVQDKDCRGDSVSLHGISFKRVTLQVDDHTRSYQRFVSHECGISVGIAEFVGWKVEK